MTDRELLEMAAKAAGVKLGVEWRGHRDYRPEWNPLQDDGDAFRLAVKLKLDISRRHCDCCIAVSDNDNVDLLHPIQGDDAYATRRAITRAAAELGKAMP